MDRAFRVLPDGYGEALGLSERGINRVGALLEQLAQAFARGVAGHAWSSPQAKGLVEEVITLLQRETGLRLILVRFPELAPMCAANNALHELIAATWFVLRTWERHQTFTHGSRYLVDRLNEIFREEQLGLAFTAAGWALPEEETAGQLLAALLSNVDDVAACRQGDIQVEMVACSTQPLLTRTDVVIVDYGAGLGRVGHGLSSTADFAFARYIAVDSPVSQGLRDTLRGLSCATELVERAAYLEAPVEADVVLLVNTLHHIPFAELARQFDAMLRSLKPGGVIILHEMGELREPEQKNVPWSADDVQTMLSIEGLRVIPRRTQSGGKKVPLAHMIIGVSERRDSYVEALTHSSAKAWRAMKERTVTRIAELYASRSREGIVPLHYALIDNANLDLNRPANVEP